LKQAPGKQGSLGGCLQLQFDRAPFEDDTAGALLAGDANVDVYSVGPSIGNTVIRTVDGLTEATTISAGFPAIVMDLAWARGKPPDSAMPAPAAPSRFSA